MSVPDINSGQIDPGSLGTAYQSLRLPENPFVVIKPSNTRVAVNLRDLWNYRDLLFILVSRDIKVRCKQTAFGAAWAIIQPLFSLLALGLGMWLNALNVKYRDIRRALPFAIQLGLFASGIIPPIPEKHRWLMIFNPVAGLIEVFRAACFGKPFDWRLICSAAVITLAILTFAAYDFRRMERNFADQI